MAQTSNLELLRRLRDAVARANELELADLDRQIRELDRARLAAHTTRDAGNEHTIALLKVLQQAPEPLPPREIASRLGSSRSGRVAMACRGEAPGLRRARRRCALPAS